MTTLNVELPATLHHQLTQLASNEGVSLDKYVIYTLSRTASLENIFLRRVPEEIAQQEFDALERRIADYRPISDDQFHTILAEGEPADPDPNYTPELKAAFEAKINAARAAQPR